MKQLAWICIMLAMVAAPMAGCDSPEEPSGEVPWAEEAAGD